MDMVVRHQRLLEPIGHIPPAEAEEHYCRQQAEKATVEVQLKPTSLHELGGGSSVLKKANFPLSAKL